MRRTLLLAPALLVLLLTGLAAACGGSTPCEIDNGFYLIRMPTGPSPNKPVGAVLFFHGYGSSAAETMARADLERVATSLGVALIAPQGDGKSWSFPGSPSQRRDEMAFVDGVLDDAQARFPINPDRIMASGFSIGGSMVWYLACYRGARFAGFAPIAGAFWQAQPRECPGPDPFLRHVHGTADSVVPMTGRTIREQWRQGDVREGIDFWLTRHGNPSPAMSRTRADELSCERAPTAAGGEIELCLHPGGHIFRPEWIAQAWKRLAAFRGWDRPSPTGQAKTRPEP